MPWGRGLTGSTFPPSATGENVSQTQVAVLDGNTLDSADGIGLDDFAEALQSGLSFASALYNTGNLILDSARMRLTNNSGKPFSFKVRMGGTIVSSSTLNSAIFSVRLRSTGNIGTGTLRKYPSGITTGSTAINIGFDTTGAFTLADGESVWLECTKDVLGTLVIQSCLILIEPIW